MDEDFVLVGKEDCCEPLMICPNAVLEVISPSIPVLRKRNALTTGSFSESSTTGGGEKKVRVFQRCCFPRRLYDIVCLAAHKPLAYWCRVQLCVAH